jgi:hypothetical protein
MTLKTRLESELPADLDALADIVNGAENINGTGTVTTRTGEQVKTLSKVIADLAGQDVGSGAATAINKRLDIRSEYLDTAAFLADTADGDYGYVLGVLYKNVSGTATLQEADELQTVKDAALAATLTPTDLLVKFGVLDLDTGTDSNDGLYFYPVAFSASTDVIDINASVQRSGTAYVIVFTPTGFTAGETVTPKAYRPVTLLTGETRYHIPGLSADAGDVVAIYLKKARLHIRNQTPALGTIGITSSQLGGVNPLTEPVTLPSNPQTSTVDVQFGVYYIPNTVGATRNTYTGYSNVRLTAQANTGGNRLYGAVNNAAPFPGYIDYFNVILNGDTNVRLVVGNFNDGNPVLKQRSDPIAWTANNPANIYPRWRIPIEEGDFCLIYAEDPQIAISTNGETRFDYVFGATLEGPLSVQTIRAWDAHYEWHMVKYDGNLEHVAEDVNQGAINPDLKFLNAAAAT